MASIPEREGTACGDHQLAGARTGQRTGSGDGAGEAPSSNDYVLRHTFKSEELRLKWVATPEHQNTWPRLSGMSEKTSWQGFGVVHPLPK